MTPILSIVLNQLKSKIPPAFNEVNDAMRRGIAPDGIVKQVMGNISPQQKAQVIKQAEQMGCPKEILTQIQNMK